MTTLHQRLMGGEGSSRIYWRSQDLPRLAAMYDCRVSDLNALIAKRHVPDIAPAPITSRADSVGERRKFVATISSSAVDSMGDVLSVEGWDLTQYKSNPVILASHDAFSMPVARTTRLWVSGSRLMAEAEFPPAGVNRRADAVRSMVASGYLKGTSVGFTPLDWSPSRERRGGIDVKRARLHEWSWVSIPANGQCLAHLGDIKALPKRDRDRAKRQRDLDVLRMRATP
jgi:HK97 family phage prohead protease